MTLKPRYLLLNSYKRRTNKDKTKSLSEVLLPLQSYLNRNEKNMIVCIAEKPSVARDIADVLGAKTKKTDI